jgi:hypothetical protein
MTEKRQSFEELMQAAGFENGDCPGTVRPIGGGFNHPIEETWMRWFMDEPASHEPAPDKEEPEKK